MKRFARHCCRRRGRRYRCCAGRIPGSHDLAPPEGTDVTDPDQLAAIMDTISMGALLFVLPAWITGAFVGGFVAGKIAEDNTFMASIFTGAVLTLFGIMTMMAIPHPWWMWLFGIVAPVPSAWWGGQLAGVRDEASQS